MVALLGAKEENGDHGFLLFLFSLYWMMMLRFKFILIFKQPNKMSKLLHKWINKDKIRAQSTSMHIYKFSVKGEQVWYCDEIILYLSGNSWLLSPRAKQARVWIFIRSSASVTALVIKIRMKVLYTHPSRKWDDISFLNVFFSKLIKTFVLEKIEYVKAAPLKTDFFFLNQ